MQELLDLFVLKITYVTKNQLFHPLSHQQHVRTVLIGYPVEPKLLVTPLFENMFENKKYVLYLSESNKLLVVQDDIAEFIATILYDETISKDMLEHFLETYHKKFGVLSSFLFKERIRITLLEEKTNPSYQLTVAR